MQTHLLALLFLTKGRNKQVSTRLKGSPTRLINKKKFCCARAKQEIEREL
jgi:hypothetical protein